MIPPSTSPEDPPGAPDARPGAPDARPGAPDTPIAAGRWARRRAALWPAWIDRNVGIVLTARFAMSTARAIAGVISALYLAAEGFSAFELGILFLCVTLASAAMSTTIGTVSDRVGRKSFMVVVPMLTAVAAIVFSVSAVPVLLFIFASVGSLGRGQGAGGGNVGPYQPAESALVAETVPQSARAAAFGRLTFVSSLGALFGGLLAGLAGSTHGLSKAAVVTAYRPAFIAVAACAAAAGLVAFALNEPRESRRAARDGGSKPLQGSRLPRWPRKSWPVLWRFWLTNGTNGLAIGMIGPFVSYWLFRRYGASPGTIGILFAIVNAGSLASSLSAAGIARRFGTVRVIAWVRGATGILLIPMVLVPYFWLAGVIFFVRMIIQRVGLPLRQSFTQDLADPEERASLAALSNLPAQGAMGGSQVLAGYLFEEVSLSSPFELAAVVQCVNAVLYIVLFGWKPPKIAVSKDGRDPNPVTSFEEAGRPPAATGAQGSPEPS